MNAFMLFWMLTRNTQHFTYTYNYNTIIMYISQPFFALATFFPYFSYFLTGSLSVYALNAKTLFSPVPYRFISSFGCVSNHFTPWSRYLCTLCTYIPICATKSSRFLFGDAIVSAVALHLHCGENRAQSYLRFLFLLYQWSEIDAQIRFKWMERNYTYIQVASRKDTLSHTKMHTNEKMERRKRKTTH